MSIADVVVFRPYPLEPSQKIRIEGGPRAGDWEVLSADKRKVTLRCPLSGREVTWDRFTYFVEIERGAEWPQEEESAGEPNK
jgi:hypothetical protein